LVFEVEGLFSIAIEIMFGSMLYQDWQTVCLSFHVLGVALTKGNFPNNVAHTNFVGDSCRHGRLNWTCLCVRIWMVLEW
jgi:hypothetical protein